METTNKNSNLNREKKEMLTNKQIEKLRNEYSSIGNLNYEQGLKLKNIIKKFPKNMLKQLASENIEWLSMLAGLELIGKR